MRIVLTGLRAWLVQRASAIYLLLFILFFIGHFLFDSPRDFVTGRAWVRAPGAGATRGRRNPPRLAARPPPATPVIHPGTRTRCWRRCGSHVSRSPLPSSTYGLRMPPKPPP